MNAPEPTVAQDAAQPTVRSDAPMVLTAGLLERPLDGYQLGGNSLAELIKDRTTLLVFLRHFG